MRSLNRVRLLGNVGTVPELRYTQRGTAVANFRVATNDRLKGQDRTEWHTVVAWAHLADTAVQFLAKGTPVFVEGRLVTRKWEDQKGVTHYTTEIHAADLILLGGRSNAVTAGDEVLG